MKTKLLPCPFCGVLPTGIVFKTHPQGRPAGYVLEIEHDDQCFIEQLSYAYYGKKKYLVGDWNRRKGFSKQEVEPPKFAKNSYEEISGDY